MPLNAEVERLALLGWRMFPGSNRSRAASFKGAADAATHDLDQLEAWQAQFPSCGWRMVMAGSGTVALDVDVPGNGHEHDGFASMAALVEQHGPLPLAPRMRSGGGGACMWFAEPAGVKLRGEGTTLGPGIDPRRGRQQLTLPPSLHVRTRQPYRWITPPWEVNPPPMPGWLVELLREPPRKPLEEVEPQWRIIGAERLLDRATSKVANAEQGQRNNTLNAWAYYVARFAAGGCLSAQHAATELYAAARIAGLDEREIRGTLRSAFDDGLEEPIYPHERARR